MAEQVSFSSYNVNNHFLGGKNLRLIQSKSYSVVFVLNEVRDEVREMTEQYEAHRGRELITFSDYCVYESLIQKHVNNLRLPAIETLKTIRGNVRFHMHVHRTQHKYSPPQHCLILYQQYVNQTMLFIVNSTQKQTFNSLGYCLAQPHLAAASLLEFVLISIAHLQTLVYLSIYLFYLLFLSNLYKLCQIEETLLANSNFQILPQILDWTEIRELTGCLDNMLSEPLPQSECSAQCPSFGIFNYKQALHDDF